MTDDGLDQASTPAGFSYGYDDFASTQTGWLACCASPFMTLNQPDAMVDLKILGPKQPGGGKPKPPPPPPPPPGGKPAPPEGDDLITKVLMPIAEELNLPIAFKFGAMRGVNPSLRTVSDEATAPSAATATATATAMSCGLWAVGCGLCVCASSRRAASIAGPGRRGGGGRGLPPPPVHGLPARQVPGDVPLAPEPARGGGPRQQVRQLPPVPIDAYLNCLNCLLACGTMH
jgi:hypothetical protein